MDLSLSQFTMSENTLGKMILPAEYGFKPTSYLNLRTFMILIKRLYSPEIIEETQDLMELKLTQHSNSYQDVFCIEVFINLQDLNQDINEILDDENEKEKLYKEILESLSFSIKKGVRGQRAAFISSLEKIVSNNNKTQLYKVNAVISTTVFYNDFRCTICYPDLFDSQEIINEEVLIKENLNNKNSKYKFDVCFKK